MRLYDIIKYDITHPDYERTVKLAADYFAFYTGKGLDEKLKQIVRREDEDMFKQRKNLTNHIVQSLNNSLKVPFGKVPRSQGVHINLEIQKTDEFKEATKDFWHNRGVKHYFDNRYIDLSWIDPNCWLFIENGETDGTKYPPVYVYEIPSENAIDYEYQNGELNYIVAREIKVKNVIADELRTVQYEHWTWYDRNETIILDEDIAIKEAGDRPVFFYRGEVEYIDIDKKAYRVTRVTRPPYVKIPCKRIGYLHDNITDGRTFISPMHPALPYYNKLLKSVSELDLTSSLHNFPQKIESVRKCTAEGCLNGISADGDLCKICGGTGFQQTHTSAQDVIQVALPDMMVGEQQLDLDNVVRYIYLPPESMNLQTEYIASLKTDAYRAIYNSEIFSKAEVTETATAKNIDMQSVYDTLYPFAVKLVSDEDFVYGAIQQLTSLKIDFSGTIEKDFKLKSYEDLLYELKLAKDSGASADVVEKINDNIAEAFYQDDVYSLEKYKTQKSFDPFNSKTAEQVMSIITVLPMYDPYRVAWTFKEAFFDELEYEYANYYELAPAKRRVLFWDKVNKKVEELRTEQSPVNFG